MVSIARVVKQPVMLGGGVLGRGWAFFRHRGAGNSFDKPDFEISIKPL